MKQLFLRNFVAWVCSGVLCAAADTVYVRMSVPHWPRGPELFLQSLALWAPAALFALPFANLLARTLIKSWLARHGSLEASGFGPQALRIQCMLFCTSAPVLAHTVLDRHTGVGQNIQALFTFGPWLELALSLALWGTLLAACVPLLARLGARAAAGLILLPALVIGMFLPWEDSELDLGPQAEGPNVLLMIWDTTRSDHLEPYGYTRETTPHLADLAQRARVFAEARSTSIFTFTSHLSMLSGRYPAATGARLLNTNADPKRAPAVAYEFAQAGYRTGGFVGTGVLSARTGIQRGFQHWDDQVDPMVCETRLWKLVHDVQSILAKSSLADRLRFLHANGLPHWFQDFQRPGEEVLNRALAWIEEDDTRPWFCVINLYDVHWPYTPGSASRERFERPYAGPMDGYLFRSNSYPEGYEPQAADRGHIVDLYDAELSELDEHVDRFLGRLHLERGDTALVLTSDHGEAFGEKGQWEHDDIGEPQVRIPMLVLEPGSPSQPELLGAAIERSVSGVDVAKTLLGLAGLEDNHGRAGFNLAAELPPLERGVLIEDRDHLDPEDVRLAYYREGWKLLSLAKGQEGRGSEALVQLFHLESDPDCERDLATESPQMLEQLSGELEQMRAAWAAGDRNVEGDREGNSAALDGLGYTGDD